MKEFHFVKWLPVIDHSEAMRLSLSNAYLYLSICIPICCVTTKRQRVIVIALFCKMITR